MSGEITQWLKAARSGDETAAGKLTEALHGELRSLAAVMLRSERRGHTLQPTAVVHEAWLRLAGSDSQAFNDRVHFFATAAQVMRRVLVDHARARAADKRGGGWTRIPLEESSALSEPADADVIALHEALERLHELSPRQARVVELRWFGGLTLDETAAELGVSTGTVENDWAFARAWLKREMGPR